MRRGRGPTRRWRVAAVPALAVLAVAAYGVVPALASPAAAPRLPARSAAQLLATARTAQVPGLSGDVHLVADLGLPSLGEARTRGPATIGSTIAEFTDLLAGDHTARVEEAGADRVRVAFPGRLNERDIVRDGEDLWTWSSASRRVLHVELPAGTGTGGTLVAGGLGTPQQAAAAALAAVGPGTQVGVGTPERVAGRAAYTLVLQPRDPDSLVARVVIALDAATGIPLSVRVDATGKATPALDVSFSSLSLRTPAASDFAFAPPSDARVSLLPIPSPLPSLGSLTGGSGGSGSGGSGVGLIGHGWTTVLALPALGLTDDLQRALGSVATRTPNGDEVLRTALLSVLVTRGGRVYLGAVSPAALERLAG